MYSYDNRYVFNANLRSDGVDIIGSKNQFAPLWSAGVRWNAQNESFLKSKSLYQPADTLGGLWVPGKH